MVELQEIFEVKYGVNLELNKLVQDKNGVNFVSRTAKNNGISAIVKELENIKPIEAGVITVSGGGSVMEAFLQPEPFYSGRDLYYLKSKIELSDSQKIFYCCCIRANKYRYSYGRQANRTLRYLIVPSLDEIPKWIESADFSIFDKINKAKCNKVTKLPTFNQLNSIGNLFDVINGIAATGLKEYEEKFKGGIMYVRPAATQARTLRSYITISTVPKEKIFPKDTLFVSTNGEGSHSYSYVSTSDFVPNSDVSVLIPKREMSIEEKLFYAQCITANRYRFSYGRKPKGKKLKDIKVPELVNTDIKKVIDYVSSLPYSVNI